MRKSDDDSVPRGDVTVEQLTEHKTQPLLTTRTMNANQSRVNATTKAHHNHSNTAGLKEHVPTPVRIANTKQTITVMEQPL